MKKQIAVLIVAMLLPMMLPSSSEAFWWLFGRTQDEVRFSYLYINNIPFDESGESITLYKDFMPDGLAHIRGRALAGKGRIGSVMVSLDGKETWKEAMLSDNGAFEFSFRPEVGRTYRVYVEAMETAGRTNDIDETFRIVTVSDSDIRSRVADTLSRLFTAYTTRNARGFMELVSTSFTGDRLLLERAVFDDFRLFDDIRVIHSLESVSTDSEGRAFALVTYDRSVVARSDGKTYRDKGVTGLSFNPEDGELKIYMMRHPVIFGVSGASDIASGVISSAQNDEILIVDNSGDITFGTPEEGALGPGESDYEQRTITLKAKWGWEGEDFRVSCQGFMFSTGEIVDGAFFGDGSDLFLEWNALFLDRTILGQDLGTRRIDSVKEVPAEGYEPDILIEPGYCYALLLPDNTYAVLTVVATDEQEDDSGNGRATVTFEYKYRADGLRRF